MNDVSYSKSVMIVDDSLEELRILVDILKRSGYKLIICRNGRDAINRASLLCPDLILLDVRMPYMDGLAVIRLLKSDSTTSTIPVIFLSAANEIQDKLSGLRLGAVDYIVKPASEEEVLLRVGIHIGSKSGANDTNTNNSDCSIGSTVNLEDSVIKAVERIMNENMFGELSIDDISRKVGFPRHKLSLIFKSRFGTTVFAWWREKNMQKARNLLINSDVSVQSISDELGFNSAANFSTAFKDRFGMSPTSCRQSAKNSEPSDSDMVDHGIRDVNFF